MSSDKSNTERSQKHREKHPSYLRGKEIGMWYAERGRCKRGYDNSTETTKRRTKRKHEETEPLGVIMFSQPRQLQITQLLQLSKDNMTSNSLENHVFKEKFLSIANGDIEQKLKSLHINNKLKANDVLNLKLKTELENKHDQKRYKKMLEERSKLPCHSKRDEIMNAINTNQIILISGETGCGKTTQIPQYILDYNVAELKGSMTKIVCTQPRRISAISVAERIAEERVERCGESSVGYHIRLESRLPREFGSITFCTTGILLKQMERDPSLSNISHLILDEIHERNTECDFLLTLIKRIIQQRQDLKIILMSATFNAAAFEKYFDYQCQKIEIPGFTYPVTEYYLEDVLKETKYTFPEARRPRGKKKYEMRDYYEFISPYVRDIASRKRYPSYVCDALMNPLSEELDLKLIMKLIRVICNKENGAILVFLPGYSDINKLYGMLTSNSAYPSSRYIILPLHSRLPSMEQRLIFEKPPAGVRKIIISTNIAETSITINDVVYVIDGGKIKLNCYDVERNIQCLKSTWVSEANADQRRGRAGRVQPGVCYHLFSRARKMILERQHKPEILRERLENVILLIKILQLGKVSAFLSRVMDPPSEDAITKSINILQGMNALDEDEKLTPLGYHLARLPVAPQMGKMILMGVLFSCLDPVLSVAASLDFKDAFYIPMGCERDVMKKKKSMCLVKNSDHLILHEALNKFMVAKQEGLEKRFCYDNYLNLSTLQMLQSMKAQLAQYLCEMDFLTDTDYKNKKWNVNSQCASLVKAVITAGLYPNVALIKQSTAHKKIVVTIDRERVEIAPNTINATETNLPSPILIYFSKMESQTKIWLHDTTMIYPLPLYFFGDDFTIGRNRKESTITLPTKLPISFSCTMKVAVLIKELRNHLNNILQYKISNPGIIDWNEKSPEVLILSAIIQLITNEDIGSF